jgi:predicted DNA-binding protein
MAKEIIFMKVKAEIKKELKEIAKNERRTLTSIILPLIENKISEVENAKSN